VTVDRGAWFGSENSRFKRLLYQGCVAILLVLTSSRAAWLAAIVGVLTIVAFAHRSKVNSRRTVLYSIAVVAIVIQIALLSPYGGALQKGLSRTFKEDDTLRHRTSGRSDQWVVAYRAITDSIGGLVYGHGPGLGSKVYADYSQKVKDIEYDVGQEAPFHSLYLELAVEAGALGLIPVVLWIGFVGGRVLRWIRLHGALLPAACFFAWVSITLSVGGNGAIGGLYIGLALIADLRNRQAARRFS
jgi:O-antigen ligase